MLDYCELGERIRKYRKACGLSQEDLAERVNISTTHMSHIETGNTKLSLSVFADLATALEVRTDDLLWDAPHSRKSAAVDDIMQTLDSCDAYQAKVISDIVKAAKVSLDKHK